MPRFVPFFEKLGDSWEIPEDLMDQLQEFTCAMYGCPEYSVTFVTNLSQLSHLCDALTDETRQTSKVLTSQNIKLPSGKELTFYILIFHHPSVVMDV